MESFIIIFIFALSFIIGVVSDRKKKKKKQEILQNQSKTYYRKLMDYSHRQAEYWENMNKRDR